jgi:DNA repair protein RadC
MRKVADLPKSERPREKLRDKGAAALSDLELLAIILGSGTKGHEVITVADRLLKVLDRTDSQPGPEELEQIDGMGPAKTTLILAALEFARRRIRPEGLKIFIPTDILPIIRHFADRKQEHFLCTSLNGANEVIQTRVVSVGLVNKTQVHPRGVFADPITDRSSAVIVAHNHPAGGTSLSQEDREVTQQLKSAGETLGIRHLDHIIFDRKGYYSFLEKGEI